MDLVSTEPLQVRQHVLPSSLVDLVAYDGLTDDVAKEACEYYAASSLCIPRTATHTTVAGDDGLDDNDRDEEWYQALVEWSEEEAYTQAKTELLVKCEPEIHFIPWDIRLVAACTLEPHRRSASP
jgi:hypothetical protein